MNALFIVKPGKFLSTVRRPESGTTRGSSTVHGLRQDLGGQISPYALPAAFTGTGARYETAIFNH